MEQAGGAPAGPGAGLLVQHEQVLAAGAERRDAVLAPVLAQPEGVLVEADRAVEVGDAEVRGAEAEAVGERGHRRRAAKKLTSRAAHSSRRSPPSTTGRWLKRGSESTSITLPAAPAFGSVVP